MQPMFKDSFFPAELLVLFQIVIKVKYLGETYHQSQEGESCEEEVGQL